MWRGSWTQLIDIGLERDDFVGSHGKHGRVLFIFRLEFINARLKLVVSILLLYILLLLGLAGFELSIFNLQFIVYLRLGLKLALNGS